MGFKNLPKFKKKIYFVIFGSLAAYLILNLGFLQVNLREELYQLLGYLAWGTEDQPPENLIAMIIDLAIFFGGLVMWIYFFGQFVMPTHTLRQRAGIPPLLIQQAIGTKKGPAIFIRDGKKVERLEESDRKGKGVILLDSASAAVLTKKGKYERSVGPGLEFTKRNEVIAQTVDLRTQARTIGPDQGDRFFFKEAKDGQDAEKDPLADLPAAKREREARRMQTSGLTRDGIEVIPRITVVFKLDANPGDGGSQFGYQADAVKKAVWHQAVVPGGAPDTHQTVDWEWLPAHLAADLWREYLRKFRFGELFNITEATNGQNGRSVEDPLGVEADFDKTAFNLIGEMITLRLTQPYVEVLDDVGQPMRGRAVSHEHKILKDHGIRVLAVNITELHVKDEAALIDRWEATWLRQASVQAANTAKRHELRRRKGEEQAVIDFAISSIGQLYRDLTSSPPEHPGPAETLRRLLRSTQASVVRNTSMLEAMSDERVHLDDMIEWLTNYKNGSDEK